MIIENAGVKGLKSDLNHLDQAMDKLGFVRWQWEYYRSTYDAKLVDQAGGGAEYYLRINARVTEGKLESPDAELVLEEAYVGRVSFPHGLDYNGTVPDVIMQATKQKLADLKKALEQ